jgi:dsDNA-specific endonuclease/ATPase MutS2
MSDTEFEKRKQIMEDIRGFNRAEQEELYRILRRCSEELSENRNGIFFDLMSLKQETVDNIKEWISFCKNNRTSFESREKELSNLMNHGESDC